MKGVVQISISISSDGTPAWLHFFALQAPANVVEDLLKGFQTDRPGKSPHSQPRKGMNAKVVNGKLEGPPTRTAQQAPQPKGQLELVPWPTMIKEVINEVLPHQLKAGDVILEDTPRAEGKEETERVSDQFSSETPAKDGLVTVQIQRERVEKTISVSTSKGGTCRGRRKVTVECSMTVAKRFVF